MPPTSEPDTDTLREKIEQLQTDLVELAFTLECRGQLAAADVAVTTSARLAELCADDE